MPCGTPRDYLQQLKSCPTGVCLCAFDEFASDSKNLDLDDHDMSWWCLARPEKCMKKARIFFFLEILDAIKFKLLILVNFLLWIWNVK